MEWPLINSFYDWIFISNVHSPIGFPILLLPSEVSENGTTLLVQQVSKKTATAAASPSSSHLWEFIQVRLYLLNFSHSPIFIEEKSLLNKANPFTGALDFPSLWPPQRCYSTQLCFLAWPSAISSLLASPFPTQMCSLLAIILSLASPQQSEKENIAGAVSIFSPFICSSR